MANAEEVLALLELQLAKIPDTKVDALILVGGFASSGTSALASNLIAGLKPEI